MNGLKKKCASGQNVPGHGKAWVAYGGQVSNDRQSFAGFTVVEALVAMALTGLVASSLLLAAYTAGASALNSYETMVASAIAEQLMDEILGQPYHEKGQSPYGSLGLEPNDGSEIRPGARIHFDDLDDYSGYKANPPVDRWGRVLGSGDGAGNLRSSAFQVPQRCFDDWTIHVQIAYVASSAWNVDLSPGTTSDYRSVTVLVAKGAAARSTELVRLRRIVAYVPGP